MASLSFFEARGFVAQAFWGPTFETCVLNVNKFWSLYTVRVTGRLSGCPRWLTINTWRLLLLEVAREAKNSGKIGGKSIVLFALSIYRKYENKISLLHFISIENRPRGWELNELALHCIWPIL